MLPEGIRRENKLRSDIGGREAAEGERPLAVGAKERRARRDTDSFGRVSFLTFKLNGSALTSFLTSLGAIINVRNNPTKRAPGWHDEDNLRQTQATVTNLSTPFTSVLKSLDPAIPHGLPSIAIGNRKDRRLYTQHALSLAPTSIICFLEDKGLKIGEAIPNPANEGQ